MFRNSEETIRCIGCGIEVTGDVWVVNRGYYCCKDCAEGFACSCGERIEQEDEQRSGGAAPEPY